MNTYAYVGGNPIIFVDMKGLAYWPENNIRNGDISGNPEYIEEYIGDLPGKVVSGCGSPPTQNIIDLDFIKVDGFTANAEDDEQV